MKNSKAEKITFNENEVGYFTKRCIPLMKLLVNIRSLKPENYEYLMTNYEIELLRKAEENKE